MSRQPSLSDSVNWWLLGRPPKKRGRRRHAHRRFQRSESPTRNHHPYRLRSTTRLHVERERPHHHDHHDHNASQAKSSRHPYQLRSTTRLHKGDFSHIDLDTVARCGLARSVNSKELHRKRMSPSELKLSKPPHSKRFPDRRSKPTKPNGWVVTLLGHMKSFVFGGRDALAVKVKPPQDHVAPV